MKKRARRRTGRRTRPVRLGYKLSSEEQGPRELIRLARMAEEHGFSFALISDTFTRGRIGRDRARSSGV